MAEISSNNKRIAKNTLMLYIRMLLSTVVSLYTSRVVLQTLGVEDFGIYGVVGGIVSMFIFLNNCMSAATSRFLTFEMGKGDKERLKDTFSSALIIHIAIALLILILVETIGVWFLNNKLVIPEGRMNAAHWVLQLSILATMVGITQVPYNATIIAHEKMDIYAYIELLHVFLKLGIVYLLVIGNFDKLILYALLTFVVNVIIAMIYRIYCIRHYEESKFRFIWKKDIFRPMLSFSGFTLYFSMCFSIKGQGKNFLINIFFGAITNAASAISTTVNGVITGLAFNIITASRPNIIKNYAMNRFDEMQKTMRNCIKLSLLLFVMIVIPFYLEAPYIIQLWLGQIPMYVISFLRITLVVSCIGMINSIVTIGIDASGNIKLYSFISGTLALIPLLIAFFLFKIGYDAEFIYVAELLAFILILIANTCILKNQIKEIKIRLMVLEILRVFLISFVSILICLVPYTYMQSSFYRVIVVSICSVITIGGLTYITLDKYQRESVKQFIFQKILRKNK